MNPTRAYDDHIATAIEQKKKELSRAENSTSVVPTTIQEVLEESLQQQEVLTKLLRQLQDRLGPVMNGPELPMQEATQATKGHSMLVNVTRQMVDNTSFHQHMVTTMLDSLEV